MKNQKIESPIEGELTPEQLAELALIDGDTPKDENVNSEQLALIDGDTPKDENVNSEQLALIDGDTPKDENVNSELPEEVKEPKFEEPKEKKAKFKVPEGENPQLTEALKPFREQVGSKPEKGCEKRVLAVIHKRAFDANGNMQSKPYAQYFDEREYQNFLKHPGGYVVELEIYNPFTKK